MTNDDKKIIVSKPNPKQKKFSPTKLAAEGIVESGRPSETSVLFVLTGHRLLLLHAESLPDRRLDGYAIQLAVSWIGHQGLSAAEVARNLGVSQETLRHALVKAGYERLSPTAREHLAHARMSRKFGNRRGRLVAAPARSHVEEPCAS